MTWWILRAMNEGKGRNEMILISGHLHWPSPASMQGPSPAHDHKEHVAAWPLPSTHQKPKGENWGWQRPRWWLLVEHCWLAAPALRDNDCWAPPPCRAKPAMKDGASTSILHTEAGGYGSYLLTMLSGPPAQWSLWWETWMWQMSWKLIVLCTAEECEGISSSISFSLSCFVWLQRHLSLSYRGRKKEKPWH